MLNKDTIVVVSGLGESEYPNIPTFQEVSTFGESLKVIKDYLDKEVTIGRMYKEMGMKEEHISRGD